MAKSNTKTQAKNHTIIRYSAIASVFITYVFLSFSESLWQGHATQLIFCSVLIWSALVLPQYTALVKPQGGVPSPRWLKRFLEHSRQLLGSDEARQVEHS
jgi:hypothetical protein